MHEHQQLFNIICAGCRKFYQKVQQLAKSDVFETEGLHTYFIPVDAGMQVNMELMVRDKGTRQ